MRVLLMQSQGRPVDHLAPLNTNNYGDFVQQHQA